MTVCLFASEVGALLGYNPYISKETAREEVVGRYLYNDETEQTKQTEHRSVELIGDIISRPTPNVSSEKTGIRDELNISKPITGKRKFEDISAVELNQLTGVTSEKRYIQQNQIKGSQRPFKKKLGASGMVYLSGKVDGYDYRSCMVIEIKTRMDRLSKEIREHEKVQILCYMYLSGCTKARFIELFHDESYEIEYPFDQLLWAEIESKLIEQGLEIEDDIRISRPKKTAPPPRYR